METNLQKKADYIRFLKAYMPNVYNRAVTVAQSRSGLSGLGETVEEMLARQDAFAEPTTQNGSWLDSLRYGFDSIIRSANQALPVYAGIKQNELLLKVNADRLARGLAPISASELSPQVNFGVSKEMQYFLFAALGIGALYLLTRKR